MVAGAAGKKPLSIAIDELYQQKVKILPEEEPSAEEGTGYNRRTGIRLHKSRLLYRKGAKDGFFKIYTDQE